MNPVEFIDLADRRALVRVDFNVPLDDGVVDNDFRIQASLPTIRHIIELGGSVVLMSHLGRPHGDVVPKLSLLPVAETLEQLLDHDVIFSQDCVSDQAISVSKKLKPGQIHLLENLRFYTGEEANDDEFSARLAQHGEIYVNDAFGTAHRAHASNVGVASHFKERAYGLLMGRELRFLEEKLENPAKPFIVVLGGAKIAGKLELIRHLLDKTDRLIIGGGMAFTFLKAQGYHIGLSLVENDLLEEAESILKEAEERNISILLPRDLVAANRGHPDADWRLAGLEDLRPDEMGVDLGPETCADFGMAIAEGKTILWNGPMGIFEYAPFQTGTEIVMSSIAEATRNGAVSIVGGGDSVSAIYKLSEPKHFSHISTGGGASLELLSGNKLPALEALR
ncbi:MAG: phosphoglycerate kinase [Candidatus Marinimicrobia bacterium]|nr:phosphoglycerate kinase [Candidatus Neomarinimicrobiota bacterium]